MEDLVYLNPIYKTGLVPGIKGEAYTITLPCDKIGDFMSNENTIYKYREIVPQDSTENEEQVADKNVVKETLVYHKVRSGEVLGLIAERYKCSLSDIREWNNLSGSRIYIGQRLMVYTPINELTKATPSKKATAQKSTKGGFVYHTIRSGDTLWDIAKLYDGVTISQLRRLNNINNDKRLKPGMKIKVSTTSG